MRRVGTIILILLIVYAQGRHSVRFGERTNRVQISRSVGGKFIEEERVRNTFIVTRNLFANPYKLINALCRNRHEIAKPY